MWWIIGGVLLLIVFVVMFMFNRGADVKRTNGYLKMVEDDDQIKAVNKMMQEEKHV